MSQDRFDSQEFHELMMDYRASLLDPAAAYERVLEFIRSTPKQGEAVAKLLARLESLGIYAGSCDGVPRTERQDGWNDCMGHICAAVDEFEAASPSVEPPPQVEPYGWILDGEHTAGAWMRGAGCPSGWRGTGLEKPIFLKAHDVQKGWVNVPVEPTPEMIRAAHNTAPPESRKWHAAIKEKWLAMIAAAPKEPKP